MLLNAEGTLPAFWLEHHVAGGQIAVNVVTFVKVRQILRNLLSQERHYRVAHVTAEASYKVLEGLRLVTQILHEDLALSDVA